ncbi:alpha/beta fold hydrolase [Streptomyces sp. NPDC090445]|uniref:alpha/beta fold hydrolase n=1 Tax=Streptomyces sp. NPDC090445 TaxID=3365963 RepID=UPI003818D491
MTPTPVTPVTFDHHRIPVADGVRLNVAVAGSGTPIVLLHGFPQTHLMWRHVAADLATDHTVICPDLRGYGDSDKPAETDASIYSKRTMAADVVVVAEALGHERFALAGHDRGALVAFRAGLDHPDRISHLAALDVLPTLDMWDVMHGVTAAVGFHLYLMAQPPRPARADDLGQSGRVLRALPRHVDQRPAGDPRRCARCVPGRLPEGRCLDRGRLPRVRGDRRGTRPGGPGGRASAEDARHRTPARLGRRPRLRRGRPVARLGHRPSAQDRHLRPLHGRGGPRRDRRGAPDPSGALNGQSPITATGSRSAPVDHGSLSQQQAPRRSAVRAYALCAPLFRCIACDVGLSHPSEP